LQEVISMRSVSVSVHRRLAVCSLLDRMHGCDVEAQTVARPTSLTAQDAAPIKSGILQGLPTLDAGIFCRWFSALRRAATTRKMFKKRLCHSALM